MRAERARAWRRRQLASFRVAASGVRRRAKAVRAAATGVLQWHWTRRGEIAIAMALVVGWMLVTYSIAEMLRPRVVWPMSIGLLLLTASGWSVIGSIAKKGLYVLHRAAKLRARHGDG